MNRQRILEDDFLKEAERIKFFMVPADTHISEQLEGLSDKCLRLYGAMLSRLSLAEKMGLKDRNDNVYIIFPQKDIARILGISLKSASNFMVALCDNGLISKKKMGQGNPDRIYVNNILLDKESCSESKEAYSNCHGKNTLLGKKQKASLEEHKNTRLEENPASSINKYIKDKNIGHKSSDHDSQNEQPFLNEPIFRQIVNRFGEPIAMAVFNNLFFDRKISPLSLPTDNLFALCDRISSNYAHVGKLEPYVDACVKNMLNSRSNKATKTCKNSFNNFEQTEHDFEELERLLLDN